jgi:hypothetical protein
MNDEQFFAWLRRQGKEKDKALPRHAYGDPAKFVKFGKKGEVAMDRVSAWEIADTLLVEWHRWSKPWRPNLGAQRVSPYCKEYREDEKHNDESDGYEALHKREMEAVEFCVDSLAVPLRQAIGAEMRNREVNAKVWRSPSNTAYSEALHAALPKMKRHEHLQALF